LDSTNSFGYNVSIMPKTKRFKPVYWSIIIFFVAQLFLFAVVVKENPFLKANNIYVPPQPTQPVPIWTQPATTTPSGEYVPPVTAPSALGPILLYFAALIVVVGIVLFVIPLSALKFLFRALFALLFTWGIFILSVFWLPLWLALAIALSIGISWLLYPRVWLHNLVMIIAVASVAAVFGRLISPWTAMIVLGVMGVYDLVAVRFGYMLWMANKMSQSAALPAFVLPGHAGELRSVVTHTDLGKVSETPIDDRAYSILGGGDIAFPLLLTASVYFSRGGWAAVVMAVFGVSGIIAAYIIQAKVLKGKPMPALPPIAVLGLAGLVLVINLFPMM
jgi:presenilin-like A22 family membrane protease